MGKRLSEAVANDSDIHLITDGRNIYLEDQPDRIIDVLKNAKQPMFLVCVTDQYRRFQGSADRSAASRKPVKSESAVASSSRTKLG
jgi:hypothetical protein